MNRFIIPATTVLTLATLVFAGYSNVTAQNAGQALEIAPPVVNLKADPGQTLTTKISLRDVSQEPLVVTGTVNNFEAAGEDGTPKVLLEESEDDADSPYSLKSWIAPLPQLRLEPRQIKEMDITIKVPANAAPGGYYGVIRFTGVPPELEGSGVSLSASLGSLIFVRVSGEAEEGLKVEEFFTANNGSPTQLFETAPVTFVQRLKNTGNTHLQPAGQVTIKDMFGQKVAVVNVNLPPRNILPESIRKFEQPLDSSVIGDKILFGRYTADLNLTYGDSQQTLTSSISFWVIPYRLIGIALAVIIGGFFLLRFLIRRYNKNIIRKSRGRGLRL